MKTSDKKILMYTLYLSGFIILLFGCAITFTFLTDYLKGINFFGDNGDGWGLRHYWWAWGCFFLLCSTIIRFIVWSGIYFENIQSEK